MAIIIVGGGFAGLLAARILTLQPSFDKEILIIEQSDNLGGLLSSREDKKGGIFDYGLHIFQNSQIPALNSIMRTILPEGEWLIKSGKEKDVRGVFFQGQFQTQSPFINLRSLNPALLERYKTDFLNRLGNFPENHTHPQCAEQYLKDRFGPMVVEEIMFQPLKKVFNKNMEDLHPFSCKLIPLERIVLLEESFCRGHAQSKKLYQRLSFQEEEYQNCHLGEGKERFYPKKYGMKFVIESLCAQLSQHRVQVLKNSKITQIRKNWEGVPHIEITPNQKGEKIYLEDVEGLVWTAGIPLLAKILETPSSKNFHLERGPTTTVINFLMDRPDQLQELIYAYCYEPEFFSFRICSLVNLCPSSIRQGYYPLMVEAISHKPILENELINRVWNECKMLGAVGHEAKMMWAGAHVLPEGYPMLTLSNVATIHQLRQEIEALEVRNLKMVGAMAKDNLFFQVDVLEHCYNEMISLL